MRDKTPKRQAEDFKDLVVAYVKQETIDPVKASGRQLAYGTAGALVISIGVLFLSIGALRLLQTETTWLDGPWSRLLSYLIVIVLLAVGAALSVQAARPKPTNATDVRRTASGKRSR